MTPINLRHYLLSPPDSIRDRRNCRWHALPAVVLRQLSSRKNGSCDQKHALATFIHTDERSIFAVCSLYWFPIFFLMERARFKIEALGGHSGL